MKNQSVSISRSPAYVQVTSSGLTLLEDKIDVLIYSKSLPLTYRKYLVQVQTLLDLHVFNTTEYSENTQIFQSSLKQVTKDIYSQTHTSHTLIILYYNILLSPLLKATISYTCLSVLTSTISILSFCFQLKTNKGLNAKRSYQCHYSKALRTVSHPTLDIPLLKTSNQCCIYHCLVQLHKQTNFNLVHFYIGKH